MQTRFITVLDLSYETILYQDKFETFLEDKEYSWYIASISFDKK